MPKQLSPSKPCLTHIFEKPDGIIAKIDAAKHLSSLLSVRLESRVLNLGRPTEKGAGDVVITTHDSDLAQIEWLAAEVEGTTHHLAKLLDEAYGALATASREVHHD